MPPLELHSPTLFVAAVAVAAPLAVLAVLGARAIPELRGLRHWGAAGLGVVASLSLYIVGGQLAPVAAAADLLALAALLLLREGLLPDDARLRSAAWKRGLGAAALVLFAYGSLDPHPERRAVVASALLAAASAAISWELRRPIGRPAGLARLGLVVFAALALGLGYRAATMALGGPREVDTMALGPEAAVPLVLLLVAEVGGSMAFCGIAGHELILRLREVQAQLERVAYEDPLTGLGSRRAILEGLRSEILSARQNQRPLTIVLLDVDRFKRINDTAGHAVGDAVLAAIGRRVTRLLRPDDRAGRIGGEELVVVLPATTLDGAEPLAELIRTSLHAIVPAGLTGNVTASLGVATLEPHDQTEISLLTRADQAMYRAKRAGGDRVQVGRG